MVLHLNTYILCLFLSTNYLINNAQDIPFAQNYGVFWGGDHVSVLSGGSDVQIKLDPSSGGGIKSKQAYFSGILNLKIKAPEHTNGLLKSSDSDNGPGGAHSEVDFELLGRDGPTHVLSTNVFAQDNGGREQQFRLWFDTSADFHEYNILWNQHQIVLFVDGVPIRVFKNYSSIGARYPRPPMYAYATLWNSPQWLGPVNWNRGPFYATFRDFSIKGCSSNIEECESPRYSWNSPAFQQLDPQHQKIYEDFKRKSTAYDYCKSHSSNNFPECRMG